MTWTPLLDGPGRVAGWRDERNPLAPGWRLEVPPADAGPARSIAAETAGAPPAPFVVLWSGSLARAFGDADPGNWMAAGQHAVERLVAHLEGVTMPGADRILVQPHARHCLSDVPSVLRVLAQDAGPRARPGLALSPLSLLEAPMLADVEDHLERILERLGPLARAVIIEARSDAVPGGAPDAARLEALAAARIDAMIPATVPRLRVGRSIGSVGCPAAPGAVADAVTVRPYNPVRP
ncbi:MAG: hypothetical protein KF817_02390 [Phycisphaeraceae bacterium]|nr:hypothetical protein [Phycisphaeraceae bacterium]